MLNKLLEIILCKELIYKEHHQTYTKIKTEKELTNYQIEICDE